MNIALCSLYSGSTGNSTLVTTAAGSLLIDAGGTMKKLSTSLDMIHASLQEIQGILITHEHVDHISALGPVCRKYGIPVYATADTWKGILTTSRIGTIPQKCIVTIEPEHPLFIAGMTVRAHATSHDAADPVCYTFSRNGHKAAVTTDTGYVSRDLFDQISGAEMILLESNHDPELLRQNPNYPYRLKTRILGRSGHLSNQDSADLSVMLCASGTRIIILGHLSQQNNTCDLALETHLNRILANGLIPGQDIEFGMTWPDHPSHIFTI